MTCVLGISPRSPEARHCAELGVGAKGSPPRPGRQRKPPGDGVTLCVHVRPVSLRPWSRGFTDGHGLWSLSGVPLGEREQTFDQTFIREAGEW